MNIISDDIFKFTNSIKNELNKFVIYLGQVYV